MSLQRAGLVVIAGPAFKSHRFRHCDLHVVDMRRVPQWLIKRVGKSQRHQVLNRFLAEIMVYAVDLLFVENTSPIVRFSVLADSRSRPIGFLHHDARFDR
jgi:hypothetical protein